MAEQGNHTKWWARAFQRFGSTQLGTWLLLNVTTYTDPVLLKLTNGRLSTGPLGGVPVGVLTTRGAKSGKERSVPVMYFEDGANFVLIASNGGSAEHPGWYYNLKANPQSSMQMAGRTFSYVAREAEGEERERLWEVANRLHVGFKIYEARAGQRQIPVMVLEPAVNQLVS